jgi:hypothetical protein
MPDDTRRLPRLGHLAKGLLDRVLRQHVRAGERARLVMRVSAVDRQGEHDADVTTTKMSEMRRRTIAHARASSRVTLGTMGDKGGGGGGGGE